MFTNVSTGSYLQLNKKRIQANGLRAPLTYCKTLRSMWPHTKSGVAWRDGKPNNDQIYLFDFVWFQWRLHTSHSLTLLAIEWWITETLVVYKHFEVSQMKVHNCYKSRDCCIVLGYFFVTRLKCHIALVIVVMVWNCGKFNLNTFLNWVAIPKPNLIYPADINIDTDSIYIMYSTHNTYSSCK